MATGSAYAKPPAPAARSKLNTARQLLWRSSPSKRRPSFQAWLYADGLVAENPATSTQPRIQVTQQAKRQMPVNRLALPAGDAGLCVDETVLEFLLQVDDDLAAGKMPVAIFRDELAEIV